MVRSRRCCPCASRNGSTCASCVCASNGRPCSGCSLQLEGKCRTTTPLLFLLQFSRWRLRVGPGLGLVLLFVLLLWPPTYLIHLHLVIGRVSRWLEQRPSFGAIPGVSAGSHLPGNPYAGAPRPF